MKATFDIVNRHELIIIIKKKGIEQQTIKGIENMYMETESPLMVNGKKI